jgi:hypothetical protein
VGTPKAQLSITHKAVAETEYRFSMTVLSAVFFPTILGQGAALEIESIVKITSRIVGEVFYVIGYVSLRHNLVVIRFIQMHT